MGEPGLRGGAGASGVGCLVTLAACVLVAIYWEEFTALPCGTQAMLVVGYFFLLGWTNRPAGGFEIARADALLQEDKFEEAIQILEPLLQKTPQVAQAWYIKGSCLIGLGQTAEAEQCWREAMKRDPAHWPAPAMLSSMYLQREQPVEAAEFYLEARKRGARDPGFARNLVGVWDAVVHAGRRAENQSNLQQAFRCAHLCTQLKPEYPVSYAWRAELNLHMGQCEDAISDARRCLQLAPDYHKAEEIIRNAQHALRGFCQPSDDGIRTQPLPQTGSQEPSRTRVDAEAVTARKSSASPMVIGSSFCPTEIRDDRLWNTGDLAFDRYQVQDVVSGGMGDVYLCQDRLAGGRVALKALQRGKAHATLEHEIDAFHREAELWFRLPGHPNVVALRTVETFQFRHLILAMECIDGKPGIGPTLHDHLRPERRLPVNDAIWMTFGICSAMQFIHDEAQLVHRDLKPRNVFVTSFGQTKVGDFGLAARESETPRAVAGTHQYMAPEQFESNEPAKPTMDIYATGVMMYEMLAGMRPAPLGQQGRAWFCWMGLLPRERAAANTC